MIAKENFLDTLLGCYRNEDMQTYSFETTRNTVEITFWSQETGEKP